jgi:hypothetical protein
MLLYNFIHGSRGNITFQSIQFRRLSIIPVPLHLRLHGKEDLSLHENRLDNKYLAWAVHPTVSSKSDFRPKNWNLIAILFKTFNTWLGLYSHLHGSWIAGKCCVSWKQVNRFYMLSIETGITLLARYCSSVIFMKEKRHRRDILSIKASLGLHTDFTFEKSSYYNIGTQKKLFCIT